MNILFTILQWKSMFMNCVKRITQYINIIKDVRIINHEHIYPIYYKYILLVFFKIILTIKMYLYISRKLDIDGEYIQISQTFNNIDRCYIIKNTNGMNRNIITNTIDCIKSNKNDIMKIIPNNKLIISCDIITNNNKINLKELAKKYLNCQTNGNTIDNILKFNGVYSVDDTDSIEIKYFKDRKMTINKFDYGVVKNYEIYQFYQMC